MIGLTTKATQGDRVWHWPRPQPLHAARWLESAGPTIAGVATGGGMRRLVLLLALVIAWFSLTKGERKGLAKAGHDALSQTDRTT